MPRPIRLAVLVALAAMTHAAQAQTDDTTPFYFGGSLGASHVSNVYRQANTPNSDTVANVGLLGGIDQRYGRQHVTLDGSLQNNRYSTNKDLNYRSHNLRGALNWQTVGDLSGVLSVKSERSLANFNVGGDAVPVFDKNIETNDEYQAIVRLGVVTRYTLEGGWTNRRRDFTAEAYGRLAYRQDTGSLGIYATPAGNVRLGLVGRHTKGTNPRYVTQFFNPLNGQLQLFTERNDYTRDDFDFTTRWSIGGHSTLNTRISRSKTDNGLAQLRDFSGTTGSLGWDWQATGKLRMNFQYTRDTGQESIVRAADLNRVYSTWHIGSAYALTGKLSFNAQATSTRARYGNDSVATAGISSENTTSYAVGGRWSVSRGLSLNCQYDHVNRDHSVAQYAYSASSYGCTGQALFY